MLLAVIVACEIGFWVLVGAGLFARFVLGRRRLGAWLLAGVPVVDLLLLVVTVLDLRRGTSADLTHGLAAVYLGFSVVFGPSMVRWAEQRTAHRWGAGPAPAPRPRGGTWGRARAEWREFGKAALAAVVSAVLLMGAVLLVGERGDTTELWAWLPRLGVVLVLWFLGWPLWETVRASAHRSSTP